MTRPRLALVVGASTAICAALVAPASGLGIELRALWSPNTALLVIPLVGLVTSLINPKAPRSAG